MAHLNVRDRVLETKIAYVGASFASFDVLGGAEISDETLALTWKPVKETTFRDCDVRVRVVAPRGEASAEQLIALLRDADGVVVDEDASLTLVHDALSTQPTRQVPIVVQAGEGVLETVERALEQVLDALQRQMLGDDTMVSDTARTNVRTPAREGNPLLTALRQVLKETVTTQVDELETRMTSRLEGFFAEMRADARAQAAEAARPDPAVSARANEQLAVLRRVADESAQLRANLMTLQTAVTALSAAVRASSAEVTQTKRAVDGIAPNVIAGVAQAVVPEIAKGVRIEQIETIVKRDLVEAATAVSRRIDRTSETQAAAIAQAHHAVVLSDAKTAEVRAILDSMIEELKKPKKGWFT